MVWCVKLRSRSESSYFLKDKIKDNSNGILETIRNQVILQNYDETRKNKEVGERFSAVLGGEKKGQKKSGDDDYSVQNGMQ